MRLHFNATENVTNETILSPISIQQKIHLRVNDEYSFDIKHKGKMLTIGVFVSEYSFRAYIRHLNELPIYGNVADLGKNEDS